MATSKEDKPLTVKKDTHAEVKSRAKEAGITIDKYIRLCLAQCKSDKAS